MIITIVDHPFYVQGRGFIEAVSLLVGDKLVSVNGEDLIVEDYYMALTKESVLVYNVNRSLGRQIAYLIEDLDYKTVLRNFKMVERINI